MQPNSEESFYQTLIDPSQKIGLRYQAVFQLKNINTQSAILKLVKAHAYLDHSVLLSHQVLYTLGQLEDKKLPLIKNLLINVVNNEQNNSLSRHEAAQALANYFVPELESLYQIHMNSNCRQLRYTCEIAMEKVKRPELKQLYGKLFYGTKQPAAPFTQQQLKAFLKNFNLQQQFQQKGFLHVLLKQNIPLFLKYRVMYYMRNLANQQTKKVLCQLLSKQYYKTQTSLLKHEICFILGQIGCENYQSLVRQCIQNEQEEAIVRHQALAAVASQSKDSNYLDKFVDYPEPLIRESAQVAQFQIHYWND